MPRFLRTYTAPIIGVLFLNATYAHAAGDKVKEVIDRASLWFLNIIISIGVVIVLIGAFFFVISGGDETKVKKGKSFILWGMTGVAIALLAKSLIGLVANLVK